MRLTSPEALSRLSPNKDKNKDKNNNRKTIYGDVLRKKKKKENIRIVYQNINGLGTCEETDKRELISTFINDYRVDCFAIAEDNVNWKIVAKKESLYQYAKECFSNSRVATSHNIWGHTKKPHQQGGVAIITAGEMALRIGQCDKDTKNLRRW